MARIRTIKPDFFTSDTVSALPLRARLTWIGLWTHCDDYGRCRDNVKLIKAAVWPQDDVSIKDIEADLNTLADRRVILRYVVDSKNYLVVTNWDEHQRVHHPSPSKIPAPPEVTAPWLPPPETLGRTPENGRTPPEEHGRAPDDRPLEQGTGNREVEQGSGTPPTAASRTSARAKRGTRIPDDFAVTQAMVDWTRGNTPNVDGRYETAQFCDYWRAKSGKDATKLDWVLTWQTWMRKAEKDAGRPAPSNRPTASRTSTTDQRCADIQALKDPVDADPPTLRMLLGGA